MLTPPTKSKCRYGIQQDKSNIEPLLKGTRTLISRHYKNAAGALIVFDVTNRYSFDAVRGWIYEVRERADEHVVIGIIGNKCDLSNRNVRKEEAEDLANQEHAFYMETTIHDIQSLRNAFERMAQCTSLVIEKSIEAPDQKVLSSVVVMFL